MGARRRCSWASAESGLGASTTMAHSRKAHIGCCKASFPPRLCGALHGRVTFLNAAVFWIFGEKLIWLRLPLFIAFLASVPCVYYIARRFVPPLGAGLVTVAASALGFPAYPAAVPSWYVLFLAIGGCAALFRYLEVSRARWLFIAGLLGGMSISVKIVGVYYVLAALCFLTFVDQRRHWGPRRDCVCRIFSHAESCRRFRRDLRRARKRFGAPELFNSLFRCSRSRSS